MSSPTGVPDPLLGLESVLRGIGGAEQAARVRRGMWLHATLPRPPVGLTPHKVIHQQDKLVVRYYPASGDAVCKTPVVVVPSLINKATVVDLEPDRSLVGGLARLGHPVYLIDWGVPGPEDADEDLQYILDTLLHRSMFRITRHAKADKAFLMGYCQGGTVSAMYTARHPQYVAGLVALATPVKFTGAGRFATFAQIATVDPDDLIGPDGLVNLDIMQAAFKMLDPMGNWTKYIALEAASHDPRQLKRALARERWLEENVPLSGVFATEFIEHGYREDRLMEGTWPVGDDVIDLAKITCPVLVTPCANDFIAPPEACTPLAEAVGSEDVTLEMLKAGHIGCVVGGFGPKVYYPLLDQWFRSRS